MTPAQIARQDDITRQRRMFATFKKERRSVPRWVKIMICMVTVVLAEFALASWLMFGIGDGGVQW